MAIGFNFIAVGVKVDVVKRVLKGGVAELIEKLYTPPEFFDEKWVVYDSMSGHDHELVIEVLLELGFKKIDLEERAQPGGEAYD